MAKILITSIGTGDIVKDSDSDYRETVYEIDGSEYRNTLTSQPIIEHFGIQKVIMIGTAGSMWDNIYFKYGGEDGEYMDTLTHKKGDRNISEQDLRQLERTLDSYLNTSGSKCLLLAYDANDNDEIWSNFKTILTIRDFLDEEDEIYLDITHGFRYMPILNIFAIEFLTQLNEKMQPKAILYGMYSNERSQILDFRIFVELLAWSRAIGNLRHYGNGFDLLRLIRESTEAKEIENAFADFTYALSLSSMAALQRGIKTIKGKIKRFEQSDHKIVPVIADELREFVERLAIEDTARFQFELARWYGENKNYAMAYITLVEAAVTAECHNLHLDPNDETDRNEAKQSLYARGDWHSNSKQDQKIADTFRKVNNIRKNIAHKLSSTASKTNMSPRQSVENFDGYLTQLSRLIDRGEGHSG